MQEAKTKFAGLRAGYADLELHLIGPLQTNKAEDAVKLFDVIETLDRKNLAEALAKAIKKTGNARQNFISRSISAASRRKAGIAPDELGSFLRYCRGQLRAHIDGLMCIPPQQDDPAPHFMPEKACRAVMGLPQLSMGMSADFEAAIDCGATHVRVGTAVFGAR